LKRTYWPNSIGYFYTMFTYYLGFPGWDNEYKVMGLAGHGSATVKDQIAPILRYCSKSMFRFDASYYSHPYFGDPAGRLANDKLTSLLGPPRQPEDDITNHHMDIAASAQSIVNDVGIRIVEDLKLCVGAKHLCLAGGVALNGVLNNAIRKTGLFEQIFVQPAAGDAGCALGNVFWCENIHYGQPRRFRLKHVYLGSCFDDEHMRQELLKFQVAFAELEDPSQTAAQLLAEGYILGWYQGRSEFGPRALGNRSILADPRSPDAKDIVNTKIKFREEFRPFAPAVLAEDADRYFDLSTESKYMLMICNVKADKRAEIPAVTHADGTARVQTVNQLDNAMFWKLINEFKTLTGTPVVLNTSFNVKDEPIVDSPSDAIRCFLNTRLDFLIMGRYLVSKQQVPASLSGLREH
jgi:carbamoyltransferase